jgi:hypothetical protein
MKCILKSPYILPDKSVVCLYVPNYHINKIRLNMKDGALFTRKGKYIPDEVHRLFNIIDL